MVAFGRPPTGAIGFEGNLRLPGQYYDIESGLSDWGFRTYEPAAGRSPQSDPMGMFGGQWSTYAYADNDPLMFTDPLGLEVDVCRDPAFNGNLGPIDHYWLRTDTQEAGMGTMAAGANAGNQYDFYGSPVYTVASNGRGNLPGAECLPAKGADEAIVNKLIKPGRPIGRFTPPFNYCHAFVDDVLDEAHGTDPFNKPIPKLQSPGTVQPPGWAQP